MIETSRVDPANDTDMASRLADCHAAAFPDDSWSATELREMSGTPGTAIIAVANGGSVVGLAMIRVVMEDAELLTIGVRPEGRGSGIGGALLDEAFATAWKGGATAMFLEVAEDNADAIALYRGRGFAPIGRRVGYYRRVDGRVNALVMRRDRGE